MREKNHLYSPWAWAIRDTRTMIPQQRISLLTKKNLKSMQAKLTIIENNTFA